MIRTAPLIALLVAFVFSRALLRNNPAVATTKPPQNQPSLIEEMQRKTGDSR